MSILVTGAAGQLGTDLLHILSEKHIVIPLRRDDADITDRQSLKLIVASAQPDVIIRAAVHTNVDEAENNRDETFRVNALGDIVVEWSYDSVIDYDRPNLHRRCMLYA